MAEREDIEKASGEPAANPDGAPKMTETPPETSTEPTSAETPAQPKSGLSELPAMESPSISPVAPEVVIEPRLDPTPTLESDSPIAPSPLATRSRFALRPRHKRYAVLAASVAIAAALGGILGAATSGGFAKPTPVDLAGQEERKAMQQSIAHLSKEITTLKSSIEAANKSAHTQIAKIGDKLNEKISERLVRERNEITGSISAPQTTVPAPSAPPAPAAQVAAPIPAPRPPQRMAAIENPPPAHRPLVQGWSLRMARDGFALVEGHGDIYQVVPGVPVPGLGMIQEITRQDGRWVVVTPRGIVVSLRDRRYFEPY